MTNLAEPAFPSRFERFAAISVLIVLGMTWPVMDLLASNAEFFIARRAPKPEILAIGLILLFGIPLVGGLLGSLPGRVGARLADLLIAVSGTSLGLLYFRRLPILWPVATALAVVAGGMLVVAFHRSIRTRLLATYLLAAPVLMFLLFYFATPTGAVLTDDGRGIGAAADVAGPIPVVLIVFDEFPVASLIDEDGNLRTEQYPNFAGFASDATWFRNAVTVEQQSEHSVPAILTGNIPDQSLTPFAGQYPFNLFTALQGTYEMHVNETITQLCPIALCSSVASTSTPIARDVAVVAGHVLLPEGLTTDLPTIAASWGDFEAAVTDFDVVTVFREQLDGDPRKPIKTLIDDFGPIGAKPPLYFLHAVVPHHPWQFLPTGQRYLLDEERNPGSVSPGWGDDEWLVSQGMQRHLLQVQYADTAFGEIINSIKAAGLYEKALVVVVADHGVTVRPGVAHHRQIEDDTVGSIAAIPLFIKAPGHPGGVIDDRRAETIDIVPTIADVVGASLSWTPDGSSLFGPEPARSETVTVGPNSKVTFGTSGTEKLAVAAQIESWMPAGDPWSLIPPGAPDLRGQVPDPATSVSDSLRVLVTRPAWYLTVDTSSDVVPARVTGRLLGTVGDNFVMAVSINGTIGAMTRTYVEKGIAGFQVMIPPELFVDGVNKFEFFEVTESGGLVRIDQ
jgi:hypothetical protein